MQCKSCQKSFTKRTLAKYDGMCGRCFKTEKTGNKTNRKLKIPTALKRQVWIKFNKNSIEGKCYVCERVIYSDDFQAGHIESEYSGGKLHIDNLQPICKPCNTSCGTRNLNEFRSIINSQKNEKVEEKRPNASPSEERFRLVKTNSIFQPYIGITIIDKHWDDLLLDISNDQSKFERCNEDYRKLKVIQQNKNNPWIVGFSKFLKEPLKVPIGLSSYKNPKNTCLRADEFDSLKI